MPATNEHEWLPLTEYAIKYKVSVSTLRRRIKAEDIKFRFEDGKYLLIDEPIEAHQGTHRPSQFDDDSLVGQAAPSSFGPISMQQAESARSSDSVFQVAQRLVEEIKRAYSAVLHEKEDHIMSLKEEIADLKTLVSVLETENDRLRRHSQN